MLAIWSRRAVGIKVQAYVTRTVIFTRALMTIKKHAKNGAALGNQIPLADGASELTVVREVRCRRWFR